MILKFSECQRVAEGGFDCSADKGPTLLFSLANPYFRGGGWLAASHGREKDVRFAHSETATFPLSRRGGTSMGLFLPSFLPFSILFRFFPILIDPEYESEGSSRLDSTPFSLSLDMNIFERINNCYEFG